MHVTPVKYMCDFDLDCLLRTYMNAYLAIAVISSYPLYIEGTVV